MSGALPYDLRHGDCREVMAAMAAESIDAIVSDPPYGTTEAGKGKRTMSGGAVVEFAHDWDREMPLAWLADAARILRPGASALVFCDAKRPGDLWDAGEAAGLRPLHTFYWEKPDPPPNPRKNFASSVEVGVFFRKPGQVLFWGGGGWCRNICKAPLAHKEHDGQTRYHPTEKPVSLMRWLCRLVTPPGGLILDPFMGSGSTGVAAVAEGFRFVGIEREAKYKSVADARVTNAAGQLQLFRVAS